MSTVVKLASVLSAGCLIVINQCLPIDPDTAGHEPSVTVVSPTDSMSGQAGVGFVVIVRQSGEQFVSQIGASQD